MNHRKDDNNSTISGKTNGKNAYVTVLGKGGAATSGRKYKGLSYANLLRCSSLKQGETSPDGQKLVNDALAAAEEMGRHVGDLLAEGVSGSQTFNRDDLDAVLELHERDPFDVLLVHDLSRLTRGGVRHGNAIEDTLAKLGIRLVSSTDAIPDGEEGEVYKSLKHYANRAQARGISLAAARGLSEALKKGVRPGATVSPFGLDRLYVGPSGAPRTLVRFDGTTQLWLDPITHEERGHAVRPPTRPARKKGDKSPRPRRAKFRGFQKQADETCHHVPGHPDKLAVVREIFELYDLKGFGAYRITQRLNARGVMSALGGRWSKSTVWGLLHNPLYVGYDIRQRRRGGLYHQMGAHGPEAIQVDQDRLEAEGRRCVPTTVRPQDEWQVVEAKELQDLLPEPLHGIAKERIMRKLEQQADPERPALTAEFGPAGQPSRHRHLDSPFLLSGLLRSGQTGNVLKADAPRKKMRDGSVKTYRYYWDANVAVYGVKGTPIRRLPAEQLEQAVLKVVREVLADGEAIADEIEQEVQRQLKAVPIEQDDRQARLPQEQQELQARLTAAYEVLGSSAPPSLRDAMQRDGVRLEAIERELAQLAAPARPSVASPDAIAAVVRANLADLAGRVEQLPPRELRALLHAMVENLVIDLETRTLAFTVILPYWLTEADSAVRLEVGLPRSDGRDTNRRHVLLRLDGWTCAVDDNAIRGAKLCYQCCRSAA